MNENPSNPYLMGPFAETNLARKTISPSKRSLIYIHRQCTNVLAM